MILSEPPFVTFQGTGRLAGTLQYFVRMAGCSVKCPLRKVCDEQAALSFEGTKHDEQAVVDEAARVMGVGGWVHLTGGEPMEDPVAVRKVIQACRGRGLNLHLQTSGTRNLAGIEADWVTLSPKVRVDGLRAEYANEVVLVLDRSWIIDFGIVMGLLNRIHRNYFYLQPLYRDGENNMPEVLEWARKLNVMGYAVGVTDQMHKHWAIK